MHEFVIAITLVFFIGCPALAVLLPQKDWEDEDRPKARVRDFSGTASSQLR